jgi:hypothetical protein
MLNTNDSSLLCGYLSNYDKAIERVSMKKGKEDLIELDKWLWKELRNNVYERYRQNPLDGYYLTKTELSNMMKWKLMRGKFRPSLQQLVDSNPEDFIRLCTNKALNILCNNNSKWKESLKELMLLKGVGIATASIILSIFSPDYCLFMSDEVISFIYTGRISYTITVYKNIQSTLIEKINLLNLNNNIIVWNMEMFGKALWSYEILNNV